MAKRIQCGDCRDTFWADEVVPFVDTSEPDPDEPEAHGQFDGEPACPTCRGLL